jgi:hypothetical protein
MNGNTNLNAQQVFFMQGMMAFMAGFKQAQAQQGYRAVPKAGNKVQQMLHIEGIHSGEETR